MSKKSNPMNNAIIILASIVIGVVVYLFVLGNGSNFEEGDNAKHPLNIMGIMYKGGVIVPLLIAIILIVISFTIERFITLAKVSGKGNVQAFIQNIRGLISSGNVSGAISACDEQQGSIANVIRNGLEEYARVENDKSMDKDRKVTAIQKGIEEATALELPMMSKNLVILSTCASIAVLIGLIGTVVGMIRAFSAMAQAGAPDTVALATGISEALVNTFFGIIGSTMSIILYNYFSSKVDALTFAIDEAGFSVIQTFSAKH